MANAKNARGDERARKTLYVTGFNPKFTTKRLLEELFTQGAPVVDVTLFDTHAYILFQDEESVPYCLALFNEVELHGQKLRLNPRTKSKDAFCYMNYLTAVRRKLMAEYMKLPQPQLPPKQLPKEKKFKVQRAVSSTKKNRKQSKRQKQMPKQPEQHQSRSQIKASRKNRRPRDKVRSR